MATTVRGKAGEDSNQLILPARKRKKPSTAGSSSSGAAAAAPPMSKSQAKKLRKLAEKKEKEKRRAALYASLEATKLAGSHAALLQSSSKVGQKETTRERLKSELRRERMGVAMPAAAQQQEASRMDKKRRRELKKAEAEAASEAALEEARIRQAAERAEKAAQEARAAAAAAAAASSSSCAGGAAGAASAGVRSALPCAPLVTDLGAMRSKQVAPTSVAAKLARKAKRGSSAPAFYVQVNRDPDMQAARMALPVCGMEQEIMEAVAENDVVIICGETGSGKTTQVPQFLYEAGFGAPAPGGIQGMIGVTQPRRVAAVSVAKRVAEELNVDMDAAAAAAAKKASASASPASDGRRQVAYQVRYDAREVGSATRVKFMTDGILLREVQEDLLLRKYSALVLDEAHERNMNTDILLGFLSRIVPLRARLAASPDGGRKENDGKPLPRLKLIIMSATLRVADFAENSTLFPVAPPVIHVKARQHPVTVHHSRRTEMADYERAVYRRVCQIHRRLPQGGILVFMTGKQEIETLCRRLRDRFAKDGDTAATKGSRRTAARAGGRSGHDGVEDTNEFDEDELQGDGLLDDLEDEEAEAAAREEEEAKEDEDEDAPTIASLADAAAKKAGADDKEEEEEEEEEKEEEDGSACPYEGVHVLPLYSMLPPDAQLAVFADPPSGMRPIVVATNVAETSITIPGMKYVVDSGREKIRQCEGTSGVSRFEVGWVSKASAAQRAGRAGRTGPGHCYRMYSSAVFENQFVDFAEPEMRRRPVEDVILRMKRMHVDDVVGFPFPIPPHRTALESAQRGLRRIGALRPTRQGEQLTSLGSSLADIPLGVRYAKMVVLAKAHAKRTKDQDFLKLALAMVAGMSVQNPLLQGAAKTAGAEDAEGGTGAVGDAGAGAQGSVADGLAGDATEKSGPDHSRWRNERSDALSLLRVIGAYSHATKGRLRPRHSDAKAFCNEHSLHAKTMAEINMLRGQLGRILRGSPGTAKASSSSSSSSSSSAAAAAVAAAETGPGRETLALPVPSKEQEEQLAQILCAGLIDRVARRMPMPPAGCGSGVPYESCDQSVEGPLFLHPSSFVHSFDNRSLPTYVVYQEVMVTSRPYMKGITAIQDDWLRSLAEGTPLCPPSQPLETPPPRYNAKTDKIICTIRPHFGDRGWPLPVTRTPLTDEQLRVRWFLRSLLEGKVPGLLESFVSGLLVSPGLLTKSGAATHPAVQAMLSAAFGSDLHAPIVSRAALTDRWGRSPSFLRAELMKFLRTPQRKKLVAMWASMISSN